MTCEQKPRIGESLASCLEKRVLEGSEYQVQQAAGLEAIERIDTDGYAAIVLDWMMPRVDGFGVIEHLARTNPGMMSRL